MFRRSFVVFLTFSLMVLAAIVGYAFTGLSGPDTALDEARIALAEGRTKEVVRVLNLAEQSLGASGTPDLRRKILVLRYQAHLRSNHYRAALVDLQLLVQVYAKGDVDLEREAVRVQIAAGEPAAALLAAEELLIRTPDDGRALELAGEACQAIYQEELAEMLSNLSVKLPPDQFDRARDSLLPYLYRSDADLAAIEGKQAFDAILQKYRTEAHVGRLYQPALDTIRRTIKKAQDYYRRSLECEGRPVSAYRGLAFALRQGRRDDDVIALSETYLLRFDHVYATQAAINAARVHHAAGRHEAVVELVQRYLPPGWHRALLQPTEMFQPAGEWQDVPDEGRLASDIRHLLLAKARALRALGRRSDLHRLSQQVAEVELADTIPLRPESVLIEAYANESSEDPWAMERLLGPFVWRPAVRHMPPSESYLPEAMRMRYDAAVRGAVNKVAFARIFTQWIDLVPSATEPYALRARHYLTLGQVEEARIDAAAYLRLTGHDEEALRLYAETADKAFALSGRGAAALLEQCTRLNLLQPGEVADSVLYLPLARLAIDQHAYEVGLASARRAAQLFNWARWPRLLWAEAALKLGRPGDAVQTLQILREYHPDDPVTVHLLREAREAAGLSSNELLFDVALAGERNSDLASALMSKSLKRGDVELALGFAQRIAGLKLKDPKIPVQLAVTLAQTGQIEAAKRILTPLIGIVMNLPPGVGKLTTELYLGLMAPKLAGPPIDAVTAVAILMHGDDPTALLRIARVLAAHDHLEQAQQMLAPVFDRDSLATHRTGAHYLLAGELALALGQTGVAETQLTAALAFPDGKPAGKLLALLLLRGGDQARASDAFWDDTAGDLTEAALLLRLGHPQAAAKWVRAAIRENAHDLRVVSLQALCDPDRCESSSALQLVQRARPELLATLLYSGVAGLEQEAATAARALLDKAPANPYATCLWAQATAARGRRPEAIAALQDIGRRLDFIPAYEVLVELLPKLDDQFYKRAADLVLPNPRSIPPALRTAVLAWESGRLRAIRPPDAATLDRLARLWLEFPQETGADLAEFEALVQFGRHSDAFELLDLLDRRVSDSGRADFINRFGPMARRLLKSTPDRAFHDTMMSHIRAMLRQHGAYGQLVHLWLQAGSRPNEQELLKSHIARFERGGDVDDWALRRTLRRLVPYEGLDAVLQRTEDLLRTDVSLVAIWLLRSNLLQELGDADGAIRSLIWLHQYLDRPAVLLDLCQVAGRAGVPTPEYDAALQAIKQPDLASQVRYARGILAYRRGRYQQAATMLEHAKRQSDGAHLYYRALSILPLPGADSADVAARLLRQFEAEYSSSRLSEIAGNLATQLLVPDAAAEPK